MCLVRGAFAAIVTAHDIHQVAADGSTPEGRRLFTGWSTLRRSLALQGVEEYLDHLAGRMPYEVLARARLHLATSAALPISPVEDRLPAAAEHLLRSVDAGYARAATVRTELESTRSRVERDHLTGLHNRHHLERYLGRQDRPLALVALMIDVDGPKRVNDTHGHAAGDALLRCVADSVRANTRSGDVLVRWGGDEFLLLVPLDDPEAGLVVGERLARAIGRGQVAPPWEGLVPSASVAVSPVRHSRLPMEQLDAALHHVKQHAKGHAALPPV